MAWAAAAVIVFAAALLSTFGQVWRQGFTQFVPFRQGIARRTIPESDLRVVLGRVGRNAHALSTRPASLFEAEQCYPARNTLALGEPMITLGLLGVPAYLLTGDPVATFNFALGATIMSAAVAMFVLVADWTAVPAAGIVAALLYAFHASNIKDVIHPFGTDLAWTLLGLFFARRLFAHGRWRDGVGLGVSCSVQLANSFYPFLTATLIAVPLLAWLLFHYGPKNLRWGPAAVACGTVGVAAFVVFAPYMELRESSQLLRRSLWMFAPWSSLAPGHLASWLCFGLAILGLTMPRARAAGGLGGDPRWALGLAGALVALMATGGNVWARLGAVARGEEVLIALPNLYALLAAVLPGLDAVRVPATLIAGVHLTLAILAGFGAAAVIRMLPVRVAALAGVAFVVLAYCDTLRPAVLGLTPPVTFEAYRARPETEAIEFFKTLARLGDSGPLLEVPIDSHNVAYRLRASSSQIALAAYHHRRTSGCSISYRPKIMARVDALSRDLPRRDAVIAVREMGFKTIVVHHPRAYGQRLKERFERAAAGSASLLRKLHENRTMSAYAIRVAESPAG